MAGIQGTTERVEPVDRLAGRAASVMTSCACSSPSMGGCGEVRTSRLSEPPALADVTRGRRP
jgi:hypothetical protein